jgi:multidrug efflux pump
MNPWAALLRQPVLVGLGAAALALFGVAAVSSLPVRSGPIIPARYIDISTNFPGADAATLDRFVTLPLESALAALGGVKYVTGTTQPGNSDINAFVADDVAPDTVFAEALAAVNAARGNLPAAIQAPTLKLVGDDYANQELGLTVLFPASLSVAAVTAYTTANIIPRLETVPGIGPVTIYSGNPALRVEMDPARLEALGITPAQVARVVGDAAAVNAAGTLRNGAAAMPVREEDLTTPDSFSALPVVTRGGVSIPLRSVASVGVAFDPGTDQAWWDRAPSVYIAAGIAPGGNIIEVAKHVRDQVRDIQGMLPPGVQLIVNYDESRSVTQSLRDLAGTLTITILLVGFIVRLSLGSMRAAAAPFFAILLSLLGAALVMQLTGQTLNLFTIIALVLAVGLVVDDAIVVVEDVFRRVQEGQAPLEAAGASVTRLAPVLAAISSTLVVAFLPLGFLSGLTAALFRPFALVLIAAFLLSLVIALTVVPYMAMWASRTYVHATRQSVIDRLRDVYVRVLAPVLSVTPLVAVLVFLAAGGCFALLQVAPRNLVPAADGLNIDIYASAPNGASIGYMLAQADAMENVLHATLPGEPEWLDASEQNHAIFGGYEFDTPEAAHQAVQKLTNALEHMDGISAYVSQENGMPGTEDLPVSVILSGQTSAANLFDLATKIQNAAYATGDFNYLNISPDQPEYEYTLDVNRDLAARLGIGDTEIQDAVAAALAGGNLGQVSVDGVTMDLVTGVSGGSLAGGSLAGGSLAGGSLAGGSLAGGGLAGGGTKMLAAMPVQTASGAMVPLGTVAALTGHEGPNSLGSWQGLPSINIQAQQTLGVSLNKALNDLHAEFLQLHARDVSFGYTGPSEIFREADRQNAKLFALGLLGLFFLLAAQFRSVRDPFVVITTVPLASLGPLLLFCAGGATLNIVTEIALLTVWGLIARQGILFVQIAHEGRGKNLPIREAALRAARLRFRPILMITVALIGGAVPLILASGPQAVIRYDLGVVLATGMGSGFLLSLFAVPAMYCLLHRGRHEA